MPRQTPEYSGFFRAEKHNGKWWLVDPAGRLFWSHGIDCVRASSGATPVSLRKHYFAALPEKDTPLGQYYGWGGWAPHGFYHNKGGYQHYNFTAANLLRKFGEGWEQTYADLAHRRIRSWGMNTIGNWSDPAVYRMKKTPYVATIHFHSKPIEGSSGYWGKFPDPFDVGFRTNLRQRLEQEREHAAKDPYCIGFFVHNELAWGNETSLSTAALDSPADQPAKKAIVEHLKTKHSGDIAKLNKVWAANYPSFDGLMNNPSPGQKNDTFKADMRECYTLIARQYFDVCRSEVKRVAPNHLYLGCRFAWVNDLAARAAGDYCDVVGYNRYRDSVADFVLPAGIDKPVIIGEFHFGALDRGMFHPGLRKCIDQSERAAKYTSYVTGALDNPLIVGTHWFLYGSQATTGRGDGENYQIGFVDLCDTPYPEIIAACRKAGYKLYERRNAGDKNP